jgi:hypothetical protein
MAKRRIENEVGHTGRLDEMALNLEDAFLRANESKQRAEGGLGNEENKFFEEESEKQEKEKPKENEGQETVDKKPIEGSGKKPLWNVAEKTMSQEREEKDSERKRELDQERPQEEPINKEPETKDKTESGNTKEEEPAMDADSAELFAEVVLSLQEEIACTVGSAISGEDPEFFEFSEDRRDKIRKPLVRHLLKAKLKITPLGAFWMASLTAMAATTYQAFRIRFRKNNSKFEKEEQKEKTKEKGSFDSRAKVDGEFVEVEITGKR